MICVLMRFALLFLALASSAWAQDYDLALNNGRVIDPESGLDAIRHLGLRGGRIAAVSETPLAGKRTLDVSGLIVAPGFIDLHGHGQTILAGRVQALDGVTTSLELEAGVLPVAGFYARREREGSPINYGTAAGWAHARIATITGTQAEPDTDWFFSHMKDRNWQETLADPTQLTEILRQISQGLDEGGLGIGVLVGYAPQSGRKEYYAVNELAAARKVPTFTHARFLSSIEPDSSFEGFQEMIAVAAATGAHMHVCHLNSMSMTDVDAIADMIAKAQSRGVKLSVEAYPYGAGATGIGAAMFRAENWRARMGGIEYSAFTLNGKPLDQTRFDELQADAPGTGIVVHFLDLEHREDHRRFLDRSILFPGAAIASDGGNWDLDDKPLPDDTWPLPEGAQSHPRSAGTFARFMRIYARERAALGWPEAIAKASLYPARILEDAVPQMRSKGRIQTGMDADIVVFDPDTVSDRSNYERPAQVSVGFQYVLVNGVVLVENGELQLDQFPGKPIRGTVASGNGMDNGPHPE
jgi:N-acyl-D-glutamate deacylase